MLLVFISVMLNYENKNDKKFKSSFRTSFLHISQFIFSTLTRKYVFSTHFSDLQLSAIQLVFLVNFLAKMQKYKIIV